MATAHGHASRRTARAWLCDAPMPPFYPNAVTLDARHRPGHAHARPARTLPGDWGLKDSFRDLDLADHGFAPLFDAEWIAREPRRPWPVADSAGRPPSPRPPTSPAGPPPGATPAAASSSRRCSPTRASASSRSRAAGEIVAGLAVMRSAGVLGFSNAFGAPEPCRRLPARARRRDPDRRLRLARGGRRARAARVPPDRTAPHLDETLTSQRNASTIAVAMAPPVRRGDGSASTSTGRTANWRAGAARQPPRRIRGEWGKYDANDTCDRPDRGA